MKSVKTIAITMLLLNIVGCASNTTKLTNHNVTILSTTHPTGASSSSNAQIAGLGSQVGGGLAGLAVGAVAGIVGILVNEVATDTNGVVELLVQRVDTGEKIRHRYKSTPFIELLQVGDIAKSTLDENGELTLVKAE
jgi:hypothetical protein